jgi:hypothetical protein
MYIFPKKRGEAKPTIIAIYLQKNGTPSGVGAYVEIMA